MKYSLFLLEEHVYLPREEDNSGLFGDRLLKEWCIHLDDYDTLEEAKSVQKDYNLKTIILTSY